MFVKWIATLIVAVNANNRAGEVAAGISFALLLALIPTIVAVISVYSLATDPSGRIMG